jgi:FkbM family methyltransferase
MKSYSQFQQDLWVMSLFPNIKGFFIDIGCCDGERISNTFLLEQNGWKGIAADPFPTNFENRKNTILEKVAIFSEQSEVVFSKAGDVGGITSCLGAWKNAPQVVTADKTFQTTITLECLLDKHNAPRYIEYFSLDTEGSEYEILRSFPFNKYSFGCITVEHNEEEPKRTNIKNLLKQHGYNLVKSDRVEDYFINNSRVSYENNIK